jgi:LAO/AO transport system kinase
MEDIKLLLKGLALADTRAIARSISIVENELDGYKQLLTALPLGKSTPLIGITGPPGAGKSSIINSLIRLLTGKGKKLAVVAVDPTSPFNFGSLLGDRLRMSEHFTNPLVYIRSLASRGSLGGLSAKIIEVTDVLKASGFDYIIVETVGVGQSEVEIVGLADTTVVVLVPEAGDEIQTIKSGIMEIADIFVVNKSDREGADRFAKNLTHLVHRHKNEKWVPPIIRTVGIRDEGITELAEAIENHGSSGILNEKRAYLLTEKALRLIQNEKMRDTDRRLIYRMIEDQARRPDFNIYSFVDNLISGKPVT